jgi:hypothetical protein
MAYVINDGTIGRQAIAATDTTQNHPLGTIVRATDPTYGAGEFIYLQGIGSTVVGSVVEYNTSFATGLETTALAEPQPNAVAMSINVAGPNYGWYQIAGNAIVTKANTVSFAADAPFSAAAGLAIAVVTGLALNGAIVAVVASAKSDVTTVQVMVDRPHGPHDVS